MADTAPQGTGWPDPAFPGIPADPSRNGFHWLRHPTTGATVMGEWSGKRRCWVSSPVGDAALPEGLRHLDYLGFAWAL